MNMKCFSCATKHTWNTCFDTINCCAQDMKQRRACTIWPALQLGVEVVCSLSTKLLYRWRKSRKPGHVVLTIYCRIWAIVPAWNWMAMPQTHNAMAGKNVRSCLTFNSCSAVSAFLIFFMLLYIVHIVKTWRICYFYTVLLPRMHAPLVNKTGQ